MPEQKTLFRNLPLQCASEQQSAQNWLPLEIDQISSGNYQGQLRELRQKDVSVFLNIKIVRYTGMALLMTSPAPSLSCARSTRR